jgi:hypothetical protein
MVKLFEEEIHIMQLFYANQSIRNVRDISNATHDRPVTSIGTIFNIISKSLVFGIVGCRQLTMHCNEVTKKRSQWRKNSVLSPSRCRKLARSQLP